MTPGNTSPRRKGLPGPALLLGAMVFLAAALWFATWFGPRGVFSDGPSLSGAERKQTDIVSVRVEAGEDIAELGRKLEEQGVIRSARLFRALILLEGYDTAIQAGEYEFSKDTATGRVIDRLIRGATAGLQTTIPEGRRLEEAAKIIEDAGGPPAADVIAATRERDYPYPFLREIPQGRSLEGFLFPDTYHLSKKATSAEVVDLMLATFQRRVMTPDLQPDIDRSPLSLYEIVTLASIVEREARKPEEQPVIASVFLNRLNRGMPLQADPTVQYAITSDPASVRRSGYWKLDLTLQDLAFDSPYNTYVTRGLPPGPIANPGLGAIRAVVRPATTQFLYFVAKPDGSHAFAATLEEHNRNVAQFQGE